MFSVKNFRSLVGGILRRNSILWMRSSLSASVMPVICKTVSENAAYLIPKNLSQAQGEKSVAIFIEKHNFSGTTFCAKYTLLSLKPLKPGYINNDIPWLFSFVLKYFFYRNKH